eukprot:TRINITY_DN58340_c0_g1_i1.p1 TRINITY_DN58340_c0_g1~~TRINITY_DN58340_c0_g1_i1.p1  ORF type:complete len:328 (-),score=70.16 TRINITY_DN58340_c0_g1_i1:19-927(-)
MAKLFEDRRLPPMESVYSQTLASAEADGGRRRYSFAGYLTNEHRMLQATFDIFELRRCFGTPTSTSGSDSCHPVEECSDCKARVHGHDVDAVASSDIPEAQDTPIQNAEQVLAEAAAAAHAAFLKRQAARSNRHAELASDTTEVVLGDKRAELPRLLGRSFMSVQPTDASVLKKEVEACVDDAAVTRAGLFGQAAAHEDRQTKLADGSSELERSVDGAELPRLLGRASTTARPLDVTNSVAESTPPARSDCKPQESQADLEARAAAQAARAAFLKRKQARAHRSDAVPSAGRQLGAFGRVRA